MNDLLSTTRYQVAPRAPTNLYTCHGSAVQRLLIGRVCEPPARVSYVERERCERAGNSCAPNGEIAVSRGRAGCIDEVVKPINHLTRPSGGKFCSDPLPYLGCSCRGHAAITRGTNQKPASPARLTVSIALTDAVVVITWP